MAQFAVHRNRDRATRSAVPLLVDIQSDLIAELGTRVGVPLYTAASMKGKTLGTLTPWVTVKGKRYVAVTPQLAGIATTELGAEIADVSGERDAIIAALDLLITGI